MVRTRNGRNDCTSVESEERRALQAMGESIILEDSFAPKMRGVGLHRRSGEQL